MISCSQAWRARASRARLAPWWPVGGPRACLCLGSIGKGKASTSLRTTFLIVK
jgi:hypothetical protein